MESAGYEFLDFGMEIYEINDTASRFDEKEKKKMNDELLKKEHDFDEHMNKIFRIYRENSTLGEKETASDIHPSSESTNYEDNIKATMEGIYFFSYALSNDIQCLESDFNCISQ